VLQRILIDHFFKRKERRAQRGGGGHGGDGNYHRDTENTEFRLKKLKKTGYPTTFMNLAAARRPFSFRIEEHLAWTIQLEDANRRRIRNPKNPNPNSVLSVSLW
jgi:hypothetical protein